MGEFAIGQAVPRFEDPRLVKGHGRYVSDMVFPGMAFGYVLRSPHAHARIRSIDTAKAKAIPGVLAVVTSADYKAAGFGDLPVPGGLQRRGGVPGYRPRYPALAEDRVRMIGDYVAFVVADTYYQAVDAAELVEVDYEAQPAIVSTGDAVKPGVPLVWEDCPNNIGFIQVEGSKEVTDAAFARAAHVVKHHFVVNRVTAATMEPRGCIGLFEPTDGRYIGDPSRRFMPPGTGRSPHPEACQSAPVSTARTPGAARATAVSIARMRACACGERSTWPNTIPGSTMSAT